MGSATDLIFQLGNLVGMGMHDLNGDTADPQQKPGSLTFASDAYGFKVMQYTRVHQSGGVALGELLSRPAAVAVNNITSGSTTQAITTGLTADVHAGKISYVVDNDDVVGAAPEGECSIVAGNTTTDINMEPDYPYSVALAVNDDLSLISTFQGEDSADGDLAVACLGVVVGKDGITDGNYGWLIREGFTPVLVTTAAIAAAAPVVADVAAIGPFGTDGQELWVGRALGAVAADQVAPFRGIVELKLVTAAGVGAAP